MRFVLKTITILYVLSVQLNPAWAVATDDLGIDFTIGSVYRTKPLSGVVNADVGVSYPLWGDEKPLNGYVRGALEFGFITDYTQAGWVFEFFPISIIGIRYGRTTYTIHEDYDDYDCDAFQCKGTYSSSFFEVPLFLGYGPVVFSARYRDQIWERDKPTNVDSEKTEFIEPTSGINMNINGEDKVRSFRWALFYKLNDNFSFGFVEHQYRSKDLPVDPHEDFNTDRHSRMRLLGARFEATPVAISEDTFSAFIGVGEHSSHILLNDPTVVLAIAYSPVEKAGY